MRKQTVLVSAVVVLIGMGLWLNGASAVQDQAETYKIDGVHSTVVFKINHLGVSNFYGRFNEIGGTVVFDKANPANSSLRVEVKAESLDTNSDKRDKHLRSPDFFNVRRYPVISFASTGMRQIDDSTYELSGDLSLHGVTRPLTVTLRHVGEGPDPWGGHRSGFETTFTIKRSDFGITYMPEGLGDEVQLIINLEGLRQ